MFSIRTWILFLFKQRITKRERVKTIDALCTVQYIKLDMLQYVRQSPCAAWCFSDHDRSRFASRRLWDILKSDLWFVVSVWVCVNVCKRYTTRNDSASRMFEYIFFLVVSILNSRILFCSASPVECRIDVCAVAFTLFFSCLLLVVVCMCVLWNVSRVRRPNCKFKFNNLWSTTDAGWCSESKRESKIDLGQITHLQLHRLLPCLIWFIVHTKSYESISRIRNFVQFSFMLLLLIKFFLCTTICSSSTSCVASKNSSF